MSIMKRVTNGSVWPVPLGFRLFCRVGSIPSSCIGSTAAVIYRGVIGRFRCRCSAKEKPKGGVGSGSSWAEAGPVSPTDLQYSQFLCSMSPFLTWAVLHLYYVLLSGYVSHFFLFSSLIFFLNHSLTLPISKAIWLLKNRFLEKYKLL